MKTNIGKVMIEHPDAGFDAMFVVNDDLTVDQMLEQARAAFEVALGDYERVLRQVYEVEEAA
ncbi:hypothetical protein [Paracoccus saliphilus]|uniref:Uncharacterized protein n=1 Tax=Paracoccus saliphilus TaxID=405559 RepID=A0AA46A7A8_9RHOB|nr:hypothetical protein [Paracoccus saliphilus]WCR04753.1 hypothetical protein JHX88_08580 [Paracoccus saliphilus]SIT10963.1 hypothetical protein SAMN05421772_11918 [Paracoccus saliphilus]